MSILAIPSNRRQQIVSVPKYSRKQLNWTIISIDQKVVWYSPFNPLSPNSDQQ